MVIAIAATTLLSCQLDTGAIGSDGPDLGNGPPTSSSGTTSSVEPGTTSDTTAGEGQGSTFGVPPDTTSEGTTSIDPDTSGSTGEDTTSEGPLSDVGLLARWWIDEAGMGQAPILLGDAASDPMDLMLLYFGGSPAFVTQGGNRGLRWATPGEHGRAHAPVLGSKIQGTLAGQQQATFELVVTVNAVVPQTSRFLHIGTAGDSGDFAIGSNDFGLIEVRWGNTPIQWFATNLGGGRHIVHVVVDTTQVDPNARILGYLDGVPLTIDSGTGPAQGAGIPILPSSTFVLGNRDDGQRSFAGSLGYAAIYTVAFDATVVAQNASALEGTDDAP